MCTHRLHQDNAHDLFVGLLAMSHPLHRLCPSRALTPATSLLQRSPGHNGHVPVSCRA
jgi:hypothetical protein